MMGGSGESKTRRPQSLQPPENNKTNTGNPIVENQNREPIRKKKLIPEVVINVPEWRRKSQKSDDRSERQELPFKDVTPVEGTPSSQVRPEIKKRVRFEPENGNRDEVAFRRKAPVEEDLSVEELAKDLLKQPVTVSLGDLAGSSPSVREALRRNFTRKRIIQALLQADQTAGDSDDDDDLGLDELEREMAEEAKPIEFPSPTYSVNYEKNNGLPIGAIIVSDPVSQYLESVTEEKRKKVVVARDSEALRTVWPNINMNAKEECIIDSGSQIVAMATHVAVSLGISWDPDITINMESANGSVERSAGLAKNVPFAFGSIVVLLQVHIINQPAYRVLLGRPFEVVTQAISENQENGDAILTLTDPNSGARLAVPTFERDKGPKPKIEVKSEGFR
jgi:hypothetical protein